MNRNQVADKLEDLAKGIREGKTIQSYYTHWSDIKEHMLDDELRIENLRVKPESKYIPFTADDWIEFKDARIQAKDFHLFASVEYWNNDGIVIPNNRYVCYDVALSDYVFTETGKPFGKEVKE